MSNTEKMDAFLYPVVSCMQTAWRDRWNGHGIGSYKLVKNHPEEVIAMLTKAGCSFRELT